jgi:hypothetical protein
MKQWNTPEIKELNISSTMQHGAPHMPVDGAIYDPERDENWYTFSGKAKPVDTKGKVTIEGEN